MNAIANPRGALPVALLNARRAVVFAPHPDDESLGCGGLIALLAERGTELLVIVVTDGGASHLGSKSWPRDRLAAQRAREAREAVTALGGRDAQLLFLGLADAAMPTPQDALYREALSRTTEALRGSKTPVDLAVLPWRRDPHRDHRDANRLARRALTACPGVRILEYAIWLDELGGPGDAPRSGEVERISLDISTVRDKKEAAVRSHHSQLGELIDDDPDAFRLMPHTLARLVGDTETFFAPL